VKTTLVIVLFWILCTGTLARAVWWRISRSVGRPAFYRAEPSASTWPFEPETQPRAMAALRAMRL
jgi:hypothetical protein